MTRPPLLDELRTSKRDQIRDAARRHRARAIAVFGSVARGQEGEDSDVDFLSDSPGGGANLTRSEIGHAETMANSHRADPRRRHYADHRPYPDPPPDLSDLRGPDAGVVELPVTTDWGPKRLYDLGRDEDRRIVYERVLREAPTTADLAGLLNGPILVGLWRRLFLPDRVRRTWEERFPELSAGRLVRPGVSRSQSAACCNG